MIGLLEKNIVPHFQPMICIDTGGIFAYELLGRLISPQGHMSLGPFFHDSLVPYEDKINVDRIIRRKAFEKVIDYHCQDSLFINIQPQWLYPYRDNKMKYPTLEYLKEMGMDPRKITIEICEADFTQDLSLLTELIYRYKDAGCRIAIDDLGKGFSNLDRIIHLDPDFLKVDASITQSRTENELPFIILETLGLLSQKMGVNLVMEGVETREQLQRGLRAGVRYFQGYFFARPGSCFLKTDCFIGLIEEELFHYHQAEVSCRENLGRYCNELNSLLGKLSQSMSITQKIEALISMAKSDWNKIYVCDFNGFQQTPNYVQKTPGQWEVQEEYLSRNWCWRPYFLPYVTDSIRYQLGMLSAPYTDVDTHQKIWTFIYPLDNSLFLFIDCQYQ